MTADRELDVLVVGAGFAGLALGACLRSEGIERFAILERGEGVGAFRAGQPNGLLSNELLVSVE